MLPVRDAPLSAPSQKRLDAYQSEIDAIADYAERVRAADEKFAARNRASNPAFREIRAVLASLCTGTVRCMYCEDAPPNQIEHIRPKSLYPEAVFAWANYLYACSPCNLTKLNRFEVYSTQTGQRTNVARSSTSPMIKPEPGDALLINPRAEDPLTFLTIDIRDTFDFQPLPHLIGKERERADYTIHTLGLNSRENLRAAREHTYEHYCLILENCARSKDPRTEALERAQRSILRTSHASVWAEMKRQHTQIAAVKKLFKKLPEALTW